MRLDVIDWTPLENPIWSALTSAQAPLARSHGRARRFPADVSPLAALPVPTPEAFADLSALVETDENVALFTIEPPEVPDDWLVVRERWIDQMVCGVRPAPIASPIEPLGPADVPEMLALAAATEPGPFLPRTIAMGDYFGIRSDRGRLIAMAGERLKTTTSTEVSAVCTDPAFRGHGHARALVAFVTARVFDRGHVPFLHVKAENGAKGLYESLGFRVTRPIRLTVIAPR